MLEPGRCALCRWWDAAGRWALPEPGEWAVCLLAVDRQWARSARTGTPLERMGAAHGALRLTAANDGCGEWEPQDGAR